MSKLETASKVLDVAAKGLGILGFLVVAWSIIDRPSPADVLRRLQ